MARKMSATGTGMGTSRDSEMGDSPGQEAR